MLNTKKIDEGKFSNFMKAAVLGAGLTLNACSSADIKPTTSPVEEEVAVIPSDVVAKYNLESNKLSTLDIDDMTDKFMADMEEESMHDKPTQTPTWEKATDIYRSLVNSDYRVATVFLSNFNNKARHIYGYTIRAVPKTTVESTDLTNKDIFIKTMNEALFKASLNGYRKNVIKHLNKLGIKNVEETERLNDWIRSFYLDNCDYVDCALAIRDNFYNA